MATCTCRARNRNACAAPDRRASLGNACAVSRLPSRSLGKAAAKLSCPCHSQAMQGHDGGPRRCLSMYIQSMRYISVYMADTTTECVLKSCIHTHLLIDIFTYKAPPSPPPLVQYHDSPSALRPHTTPSLRPKITGTWLVIITHQTTLVSLPPNTRKREKNAVPLNERNPRVPLTPPC